MCMCVYVCVCVCVDLCVWCVHVCVTLPMCMCICICTCVLCIYVFACVYLWVCVDVSGGLNSCGPIDSHIGMLTQRDTIRRCGLVADVPRFSKGTGDLNSDLMLVVFIASTLPTEPPPSTGVAR